MCLNFVAVTMNSGGGVVRDKDTGALMVKQIGEFENRDDAIKTACEILDCTHILNGVLARGNHTGGFLLCDSQELSEL